MILGKGQSLVSHRWMKQNDIRQGTITCLTQMDERMILGKGQSLVSHRWMKQNDIRQGTITCLTQMDETE